MNNSKKMIEMFPDATKEQRVKKLWKEQAKENHPVLAYILISGVLCGLLVVFAVLNLHGLFGAYLDKFDTSPYTPLFILVIVAAYLLFDGTIKRWFYGR